MGAVKWCVACNYLRSGVRENLLEHRTVGTDVFGALYIGAEKIPYRESFAFPTTGIL